MSTKNSETAPVRKGQIEVAKRMNKILDEHRMAELEAVPKWGKTIAVSIASSMLHHSRQQKIPPNSLRRNTLVWNWSPFAPWERKKCIEYGTFDESKFVASDESMVWALRTEIEEHGFASVYSSKESFNGAFGTKVDKRTNNTTSFCTLNVEDIRTTKPQTLPKVSMLIDTLQVKTLVIVIDEHQALLGQESQNYASLVANHVALSQAEWKAVDDRYDVYVIAASATPEAKSPSVSRRTHIENMELFYKRRDPSPKSRLLDDVYDEVWNKFRSSVVVTVTEEELNESLDNFRWLTGNHPSGGVVPRCRENIISPPTNGTVVNRMQTALVMQALMDNTNKWIQNWGTITLSGKTANLYFVHAKPKYTRENDVVLSPGIVHASVRGYQSVHDAVAFVRGHFVQGRGGIEIHSKAPQQVLMRKVTRLTHDPKCPVDTVPNMHYHCVLVVIGQTSTTGLAPLRDACREANEHTTIHNLTNEKEDYIVNIVNGKIKDEFTKNNKQIYIVARLGQIVGTNCFGDFVTACVTIGNIPSAVRRQCYERLGRSTNPKLDDVIPNAGNYKFFHLGSSATQRLDNELNHSQPNKTFYAMVATGKYDQYKEMDSYILKNYGEKASFAFRKYFFYSTGGLSSIATPIDIGGSVSMTQQYCNMLAEKESFSVKWENDTRRFLTWMAKLRE